MEFTHDRVEDSWRLSSIQNSDFTLNGGYIFVYADCGHAIDVPDHLSYFCSKYFTHTTIFHVHVQFYLCISKCLFIDSNDNT